MHVFPLSETKYFDFLHYSESDEPMLTSFKIKKNEITDNESKPKCHMSSLLSNLAMRHG